jgi:hypothetical protein
MKKNILIPIFIVIGLLVAYATYLITLDESMQWAKTHLPLGPNHVYTIEINESVIQVDGTANPAGGYVYTIVKSEDEGHQQLSVAGRLVGSSAVDLTPFIDKPVTITGNFYKGKPLLLQTDNVPEQFTWEQVVMHIESVTLVAEE